ncbi:MAG: hypothetical protein AB1695_00840 [Stygiobacter sp.]|jgi:hypothetical protein|uniref:Uncharacterized protein n=1 Tax=Stygiobacter electus TaxID=3032292 RepID=A0AAE3P1P1_9BACT|nr:hypothetical protein [Stygiobacter electus]MDF1612112.1 hypothetical protein [Stygiobacter electus]
MDKYYKAIKENICKYCVDSSEDGNCTLNEQEICAVEFYLKKIVKIVHSIDTDEISIYHQKLRDEVCSKCKTSKDEYCYLREDANCSLDRYFALIVETIKKVDAGLIN